MAARLDGITRRANTLSELLQEGLSIRAADMPGAGHLTMQVYAAMARKEGELISERIRAALPTRFPERYPDCLKLPLESGDIAAIVG